MVNRVTNILDILTEKGLFSGYSFREKVENCPEGNTFVIQMKDIEQYTFIKPELSRTNFQSEKQKYFLQNGDILFMAKGSNNYALVYDLDLLKAVAASAFFVLRPDRQKINPYYLSWYINQSPVQKYLKANVAGTYVPNVNRQTIAGIQILLPDRTKQNLIAQITGLSEKEQLLLEQIKRQRKSIISNQLMKTLGSGLT